VGTLPELPVLGHRLLLAQMLSNLVQNAFTYTAGHGGCVAVAAARERIEGSAWGRIEVRDSGPGIAAEHLPHLFNRFYRVDQARGGSDGSSPGTDATGSGLGLAIVQWVASAHGGSAHVESDIGQGSVFVVRLPLVAATAPLPVA
jgi:signal transduction histidine kinase